MSRPGQLYGLLLAGGKSSRMGRDKASLVLAADGRSQAENGLRLLETVCERVFLSLREGQPKPAGCEAVEVVRDTAGFGGPLAGILSAFEHSPDVAWLVLACDLPFVSEPVIARLLEEYRSRPGIPFVVYASATDGLPEPLCAIYGPSARPVLAAHAAREHYCPRHILIEEGAFLLELPGNAREALANINTPGELERAERLLRAERKP